MPPALAWVSRSAASTVSGSETSTSIHPAGPPPGQSACAAAMAAGSKSQTLDGGAGGLQPLADGAPESWAAPVTTARRPLRSMLFMESPFFALGRHVSAGSHATS